MTSLDGGGDHEFEGARLSKLTLHPLIWLGSLMMMAFLAGTAGAVMAVWPTTCAWCTAGLVVVPVVAAASRHLGSTPFGGHRVRPQRQPGHCGPYSWLLTAAPSTSVSAGELAIPGDPDYIRAAR